MDPLVALLVAPFALALASFLNVLVSRVPEGRSLMRPASACQTCATPIAWRDNVPVLSYLWLRGRCRTCQAPIGARYLWVELIGAAAITACVARFGITPRGVGFGLLLGVLVALSAIDIERRILPNRIVLPLLAAVVIGQFAIAPDRALEWGLAALGASGYLFLALLAYPAGMGMGDVKLAAVLGAALGASVAVALLVGMLAAIALGAVLFLRHGAAARRMAIPFGPFLAIGAAAAVFWGDPIVSAYARLLA